MTAWIYPCPDCGGDLDDDGSRQLWCTPCDRGFMLADFPDDDREASHVA